MNRWPKSLTAVVHVKLSYDDNQEEEETRPAGENEVAPLDKLRDRASKLDPYMMDLVIRFAEEMRSRSFSGGNEGG